MDMISFSNICKDSLNFLETEYNKINFLILDKFKLNRKLNVIVALIKKNEIHSMNKSFRKIDRPTDVLSFSYFDDFKGKKLNSNDEFNIIGEIYICPEVALENIKDEDTTLEKEMVDLFIHGMLHILGYDHMSEMEEKEMKKEHENIKNLLDKDLIKNLAREAKSASKMAVAPYSNFKVGAAIHLTNNKIIKGANIENAAYPVTVCAERAAMFSCICQGENIKTADYMAVWTDTESYASPCGSCRQVMKELLPSKCKIVLVNNKLDYKVVSLDDLLPFGFTDKDLFSKTKK